MRPKSPVLKGITYIATACLLLALGMALDGPVKYHMVKRETQALADTMVTRVATDWDPDVLQRYAHADLIRAVQQSGQTLRSVSLMYAGLGKLQKFEGCAAQSAGAFVGVPAYGLAQYQCHILTENAEASIGLVLRKDDGANWQIMELSVTSPYFQRLIQGRGNPTPQRQQ